MRARHDRRRAEERDLHALMRVVAVGDHAHRPAGMQPFKHGKGGARERQDIDPLCLAALAEESRHAPRAMLERHRLHAHAFQRKERSGPLPVAKMKREKDHPAAARPRQVDMLPALDSDLAFERLPIEAGQPEEVDDVARKVAEHLARKPGRGLGRRRPGEDVRQVGQHRAPGAGIDQVVQVGEDVPEAIRELVGQEAGEEATELVEKESDQPVRLDAKELRNWSDGRGDWI